MTQSNKMINYNLDKMPNGDFVGECYMLTHEVIKALGNYNTNGDKDSANKQFIKAETIIRDYVWKSCQRAALTPPQSPNRAVLDALNDARLSMLDSGYNPHSVIIKKCDEAIAAANQADKTIDLEALKHDACIDCEAMNSTESCFVEMAIDYIATRYDFVRKV